MSGNFEEACCYEPCIINLAYSKRFRHTPVDKKSSFSHGQIHTGLVKSLPRREKWPPSVCGDYNYILDSRPTGAKRPSAGGLNVKKQWLLQLQLAPLLVLMLILQITLSQLGQSWRALCWMLTLKSTVSQETHQWKSETWCWSKPVDETIWEKCVQREAYSALERGDMKVEAKGAKLPPLMPSTWQSIVSGWQSLRQRKRNSPPQYSQKVMVFSISPNRWTIQTRKSCIERYALLLNAEFEWPIKQRAPWGPFNFWLPVCLRP